MTPATEGEHTTQQEYNPPNGGRTTTPPMWGVDGADHPPEGGLLWRGPTPRSLTIEYPPEGLVPLPLGTGYHPFGGP